MVYKRGWSFAALLKDFRVACLDLALPFRVDGAIPKRRTVVCCALENGQVGDFLGNFRDELDGGSAGADDPHTLAG